MVQRAAADLAGDAGTPREAAIRIYYFVRDAIKHHWVPMGQTASVTLRRRVGDCWPKSILQVAMLRAVNIPARFRWLEYHKQLFAGLVPTAVYETLADPFPFHVLAETYIDDRWVRADATFDQDLRPDRAQEWDGITDLLALYPDEISKDLGFTASFEERIPEIERFFGGPSADSDGGSGSNSDVHREVGEKVDVESELVNLYFEFIRFRNRFEQACGNILRTEN